MSESQPRELPEIVAEVTALLTRLNTLAADVRALQYPEKRERLLLKAIGMALYKLGEGVLDPILLEHPELIPHPDLDPRRRPPPKQPKSD